MQLLQKIIIGHLVLISFINPVKSFTSNPLVRDLLIYVAISMAVFVCLKSKNLKIGKLNYLDLIVIVYFLYGIFHFILSILLDFELFQSISQFRTLYLPALLYFIVRFVVVGDAQMLPRMQQIIIVLFFINVIYLLLEFSVSFLGIYPIFLPWHDYAMFTLDRMSESAMMANEAPSMRAVGLGSFPHFTAPFLAALFALFLPFIKYHPKLRKYDWVIILLALLCFFVLKVKAMLIAVFLIVALQTIFGNARDRLNFMIYSMIFIFAVSSVEFLRDDFLSMIQQVFVGNQEEGSRITLLTKSFFGGLSVLFNQDSIRIFFFGVIDRNFAQGVGYGGGAQVYEIALFNYIVIYGVIWGVIIVSMSILVALYSWDMGFRRIQKNKFNRPSNKTLFCRGILYFLIIYLADLAHFGQAIYAPNIDLIFVIFGLISVFKSEQFLRPVRVNQRINN